MFEKVMRLIALICSAILCIMEILENNTTNVILLLIYMNLVSGNGGKR